MGDLSKFKTIITELTELFEELIVIETRKLNAVVENNLKDLEDCMKEEQVSIMKLKVLEKKRTDIQDELGLSKLTFKEIIETLENEEKEELQKMYGILEETLTNFNKHADSTKVAIETNLHSIDHILEGLKNNSEVKKQKSFTSKKV